MNPLEFLFAIQRMQQGEPSQLVPQGMALPYQDITQQPRPPVRGFRDPEQAGPAPPVNGPLASMFGGRGG